MPQLSNETFATFVRAGNGGSSFLVERSMYWDAGSSVWAGGTSGIPLITPQSIFVP
jgi:hypothetical protein